MPETHPSAHVVVNILQEHKTWLTAKSISKRAAAIGHYIHPRMIGDVASSLSGAVIGSGKGYKLARNATQEEILGCWQADMRRSIGTEKRAREVIHYARTNRLLGSKDSDDTLNQLRLKIMQEVESGVLPSEIEADEPDMDEERDLTAPARLVVRETKPVEQIITHPIFLIVVIPELGAADYFQRPYAACLTQEAADAIQAREAGNISEGRLFAFADKAAGIQPPALGAEIYCLVKNGCTERLFTDKEKAETEALQCGAEIVPVEVIDV